MTTPLANRSSVGPNAVAGVFASQASKRAANWMPGEILAYSRKEVLEAMRREMAPMSLAERKVFLLTIRADLCNRRDEETNVERRRTLGQRLSVMDRELGRINDELQIERARESNNQYALQVATQNRLLHRMSDQLRDFSRLLRAAVGEEKWDALQHQLVAEENDEVLP